MIKSLKEGFRMKKKGIALSIGLLMILVLAFVVYGIRRENTPTFGIIRQNTPTYCFTPESNVSNDGVYEHASYEYVTFEGALKEVNDVVIAQCVGYRPFGENYTEIEFLVLEWIVGEPRATEGDVNRIFVYVDNHLDAFVEGGGVDFQPSMLTLMHGTDYLLPLLRTGGPYSYTPDNSFRFSSGDVVIDLDNPKNSVMYTESLSNHTTGLNLHGGMSKDEIIAYVQERTEGNPLRIPDFIRSEDIEDIINGSSYVWIVEINEERRLTSGTSVWMSTDIYYVTVVESLKGNTFVSDDLNVMFFANTVFPGEQHIVAVEPISEGSMSFDFTSRNSLFAIDQLDVILEIIGD